MKSEHLGNVIDGGRGFTLEGKSWVSAPLCKIVFIQNTKDESGSSPSSVCLTSHVSRLDLTISLCVMMTGDSARVETCPSVHTVFGVLAEYLGGGVVRASGKSFDFDH